MSYTSAQLKDMGITKLKGVAKDLGIKRYSTYKKANKGELETLILDAQRKASPKRGPSPRRSSEGKERASPKRGPSPKKVLTKAELKKLTVKQLKNMLTAEEMKELRKKVREEDPARKSPPRKNEWINAVHTKLKREAKERASPKRGSSPRRSSEGKERASPKRGSSPRRSSKGKERASPRRTSKDKTTPELGIELRGWTVVGELEAAFLFLKSFDRSRLMDRLEKEGKKGLVRLEPDPGCEINCGAEALGIKMKEGEYRLDMKMYRNFVQEVKLGEMEGAKTAKVDFSFLQTLVIADLSALLSYIEDRDVKDIEAADPESTPSGIVLIRNPPNTKTPRLMNVLFPGKTPSEPFKGMLLQKVK